LCDARRSETTRNDHRCARIEICVGLHLSALDLVPLGVGGSSTDALRASAELARTLDRAGYTRLWYAEHHNMAGIATTTPEILIAHVAPLTSRIRIGAGGVMLPNHAPLKVAESYRLLEALHPGRVDLGIGRAPGTDPIAALALRRSRQPPTADDFLEQLGELMAFEDGDFPPDHPFRSVHAMPDDVPLPPMWLLGSSDFSAKLAGNLGVGFAFAAHFSPEPPEGPMRAYRELFTGGGPFAKPYAVLALSVFCADTEDAATRMASSMLLSFVQLRLGRPVRLPSPDEAMAHVFSRDEQSIADMYKRLQIVGTPEQCRGRIEDAVARTNADEVMIATHAYDAAARAHSYELLAGAFGLAESR
jgi:luciferase family oxidoreductase group 1